LSIILDIIAGMLAAIIAAVSIMFYNGILFSIGKHTDDDGLEF
jgi:hypothetical protein